MTNDLLSNIDPQDSAFAYFQLATGLATKVWEGYYASGLIAAGGFLWASVERFRAQHLTNATELWPK